MRSMEGKRSWWIGRASNPVGGAMRCRAGSTPVPLRRRSFIRLLRLPISRLRCWLRPDKRFAQLSAFAATSLSPYRCTAALLGTTSTRSQRRLNDRRGAWAAAR